MYTITHIQLVYKYNNEKYNIPFSSNVTSSFDDFRYFPSIGLDLPDVEVPSQPLPSSPALSLIAVLSGTSNC